MGRDPTSPTILHETGTLPLLHNPPYRLTDVMMAIDEVFVLQCSATAGYFHIQYLNQYSDPIPYNADIAYLDFVFSSFFSSILLPVDISITMPANPNTGLATVCEENYVQSTTISFSGSTFADYPPMRLLTNVSLDTGLTGLVHSTRYDLFERIRSPGCNLWHIAGTRS